MKNIFIHPVLEIGRRGFPIDNLVCEFACINDDPRRTTNEMALHFYSPTHRHKFCTRSYTRQCKNAVYQTKEGEEMLVFFCRMSQILKIDLFKDKLKFSPWNTVYICSCVRLLFANAEVEKFSRTKMFPTKVGYWR